MLVAMAVDAVLGWPGALFARIGHPVSWLGGLIGALDARWNRASDSPEKRRVAGVAAHVHQCKQNGYPDTISTIC